MSECELKDYFMRHGTFSWNELATPDLEKSKAFYGEIFGWTFREETISDGPLAGKPYVVALNGENAAGGMLPLPCDEIPPHWGAYVTVDNMDQTLAKVQELGGNVVIPGTPIKGLGAFAVIQDTTGAYLMLMEYLPQE